MKKVRQTFEEWYSALLCINTDGSDLAKKNGEFGVLKYAGHKPFVVKAGAEADIPAEAPRYTRGRTFKALVENAEDTLLENYLAIGKTFPE